MTIRRTIRWAMWLLILAVSAVKLGYKQVKYLTEANFLAEPSGGYWEDQGYNWFSGL